MHRIVSRLLERLNAELSDRYHLTGEAGAGGMATVYVARDLRHARQVALKVLRPELAEAIGAERFHAEIATTARLQHPNILPLFDSGSAAGCLFYVMPYVEGPSLAARLQREPKLPLEEALQITCTVAAALQHAHDHGVVHRDIKPDNILLSGGVPVLADFGIALAPEHAGRLTQTGIAIGTVAYMSPEQAAAAGRPDARSDIYSLACVLYQTLAGEPPHAAANIYAVLASRLSERAAPIRTRRPDVPGHVESALLRALAVDPADRFATAADFAAALRPAPPPDVTGQVVFLRAEPRSYGVLMHEGDDDALRLARDRARRLVESVVESSGGVLQESPGGAVVGCFPDHLTCVGCATAAREAVVRLNAALPAAERVHYRFGVADGPHSKEQASELAWSAASDGISVSGPVRETLAWPVPGDGATGEVAPPGHPRLPPQLESLDIPAPARPSIAIMPFRCAAGDAEAESLAEGLRIDITNALMKMGRIFLVAPSSMNRFRGAPGVDTARRVGTRHVLEGTVRRSGGRVRVTMELTDAQTERLVWTDRYDRLLDDAFALEDEIAERVITELDVRLSMGEQARLWRKCLTHPDAREHYYRGLGHFFQSTCDSIAAARAEFERVARLVPDSPVGATWTALSLWIQATHGWDADAPRLSIEWARRAVELPDADGQAHTVLGATLLLEGQWDEAVRVARDSVRIRPGCNTANGILANVLLHCADYGGAILHAKRAMRIGPVYPPWFLEILSAAHRESGDPELAITVSREILRLAPESVSGRLVLASALARAGWIDEARTITREVARLEPGFEVDTYVANQPFRSDAVKDRLREDLRAAGLDSSAAVR